MEINYSKFSRVCKVSRQAISKALNEGLLQKNENNKIDLDVDLNINYLISHGGTKKQAEELVLSGAVNKPKKIIKKQGESKSKLVKKEILKDIPLEVLTEEIQDFSSEEFESITNLPAKMMNMTLKQLVIRFGGPMQLKTWAEILTKIMMASERDQKIQIRKLGLIEKDFVTGRLFNYIETLHNQIFNIPMSIADNIVSIVMVKKESSRQEIIDILKMECEKLLKDCKSNISKELDNLKNKFDTSENESE